LFLCCLVLLCTDDFDEDFANMLGGNNSRLQNSISNTAANTPSGGPLGRAGKFGRGELCTCAFVRENFVLVLLSGRTSFCLRLLVVVVVVVYCWYHGGFLIFISTYLLLNFYIVFV
jgi:hypothetical protein